MAQLQCPNCDMQQSEWLASEREGYRAGGVLYCCEGCATGAGCTCRSANQGARSTHGDGTPGETEGLMSPRDDNGRPVDVTTGSGQAEASQLLSTAPGLPPASPDERVSERDVGRQPAFPEERPIERTAGRPGSER